MYTPQAPFIPRSRNNPQNKWQFHNHLSPTDMWGWSTSKDSVSFLEYWNLPGNWGTTSSPAYPSLAKSDRNVLSPHAILVADIFSQSVPHVKPAAIWFLGKRIFLAFLTFQMLKFLVDEPRDWGRVMALKRFEISRVWRNPTLSLTHPQCPPSRFSEQLTFSERFLWRAQRTQTSLLLF